VGLFVGIQNRSLPDPPHEGRQSYGRSEGLQAFFIFRWTALEVVLFPDAEAGEDFAEQVIGSEFARDAVKLLLRLAQLFGE
jgi:hypothetical protein